MGWFDLNAFAQASAGRIVDCVLGGMLIAIFAAAIARLARRQESKIRFAIWMAALTTVAGLPLLAELWSRAGGHAVLARNAAVTVPGEWAIYIVAGWAAIAAVGLIRIAFGLWRMRALRNRCTPVNFEDLNTQLKRSLEQSSARSVPLCVSDEVNVPAAIGLMEPAVVFPAWAFEEMSVGELNQILLHELAHLERGDDWTNLAQKIVKAVFFFHPAVWWIERQLSIEREMACDDVVLAKIESPRSYAECLAHLAEKSFIQRSFALAQAALGQIRQTSQRVARILDGKPSASNSRTWKLAVPAVTMFALASGIGILRAPQLVAFRSTTTSDAPVASMGSDIDNMHVPMIQAKLRESSTAAHPNFAETSRTAKPAMKPAKRDVPILTPANGRMFHLASVEVAPAVATQAVFLIVEEQQIGQTDQGFYSIRIWRLTVYHPAPEQAENKIPSKET